MLCVCMYIYTGEKQRCVDGGATSGHGAKLRREKKRSASDILFNELKNWMNLIEIQDREFVELDNPYNGAPKRPGSPSPLASPAHSSHSRAGLLQACCGRCCPQRYQVKLPTPTSRKPSTPTSSTVHRKAIIVPFSHTNLAHTLKHTQIPDTNFTFP